MRTTRRYVINEWYVSELSRITVGRNVARPRLERRGGGTTAVTDMPIAKLSPKEMKRYERRFIDEVWNEGKMDLLEETVSEDYVGHWFSLEGDVDRDGFRRFIEDVRAGFSDFEMRIEYVIAEDDSVAVAFTTTGTHDGEFMDIPATGKRGLEPTPGIFIHKFDEDGMLVEAWATWDALGLLQKLGVAPERYTLTEFLETAANVAKQDIVKRTRRA